MNARRYLDYTSIEMHRHFLDGTVSQINVIFRWSPGYEVLLANEALYLELVPGTPSTL
jgi:hypothetical protein